MNFFARSVTRQGLRALGASVAVNTSIRVAGPVVPILAQRRAFSAAAPAVAESRKKVLNMLQKEVEHEKNNSEQPMDFSDFLKNSSWTLEQKEGCITTTLTKEIDGKKVTVDFQLVAPSYADDDTEEGENEDDAAPESQETTDFSVSIENKEGAGITCYCTTITDDDKYRYMVGNVKFFANEEEKNGSASYLGPDFEDLDESLQKEMDSWLDSIGINADLCNFIDTMAAEKEQKEYVRWLNSVNTFFQS